MRHENETLFGSGLKAVLAHWRSRSALRAALSRTIHHDHFQRSSFAKSPGPSSRDDRMNCKECGVHHVSESRYSMKGNC